MVEKRRNSSVKNIPNVLIIDPIKGWYLARREGLPEDARRWQYGQYSVLLMLQKGEDLRLIDIPHSINADESPERLFRALNWKVVKALFSSPPTWMEKLNPVVSLGVIGLMLFFIYLLTESYRGG